MMQVDPGEARKIEAVHAFLAAVLVAIRPLVWDGEPTATACGIWLLLAAGCVLFAGVRIAVLKEPLRWGPVGLAAAILAVLYLPAAVRAPSPAEGFGLYLPLIVHLAFAASLVQIASTRAGLIAAAILAGLAGEGVVAVLQRVVVLPAMADGLAKGTLAIQGLDPRDVAERIARGGIYGTFTISNTLGAFAAALLPAAVATAVLAGRSILGPRPTGPQTSGPVARGPGGNHPSVTFLVALAVAGLGLAALWLTGSKGAWLALIAGAGLTLVVLAPGWLRRRGWSLLPAWLLTLAIAAGLGYVAVQAAPHLPGVRSGIDASAQVRLGYWRAAGELIRERPLTGHGIAAFSHEFSRVIRPEAEPARLVHCEPLEAAVDAGVLAGLALIAVLALLLIGPWRAQPAAAEQGSTAALISLPAWSLVAGCATAAAMLALAGGMFGNLGWWEQALLRSATPTIAGQIVLAALLGALIGVVLTALRKLPPAPAWAWRLGLAALVLHCCIDFDLHAGAMWIVAAGAVALCGPPRWTAHGRTGRLLAVAAIVASILAAAGMIWLGTRLTQATIAISAAEAAVRGGTNPTAWAEAATVAGCPPPQDSDQRLAVLVRLGRKVLPDADLEPGLLVRLANVMPGGESRLGLSLAAVEAMPSSWLAHRLHADDLRRCRRWDDAVTAGRQALATSPWSLDLRAWLADLLADAATHLPAQKSALETESAAMKASIAELRDRVHFRWRGAQ